MSKINKIITKVNRVREISQCNHDETKELLRRIEVELTVLAVLVAAILAIAAVRANG